MPRARSKKWRSVAGAFLKTRLVTPSVLDLDDLIGLSRGRRPRRSLLRNCAPPTSGPSYLSSRSTPPDCQMKRRLSYRRRSLASARHPTLRLSNHTKGLAMLASSYPLADVFISTLYFVLFDLLDHPGLSRRCTTSFAATTWADACKTLWLIFIFVLSADRHACSTYSSAEVPSTNAIYAKSPDQQKGLRGLHPQRSRTRRSELARGADRGLDQRGLVRHALDRLGDLGLHVHRGRAGRSRPLW